MPCCGRSRKKLRAIGQVITILGKGQPSPIIPFSLLDPSSSLPLPLQDSFSVAKQSVDTCASSIKDMVGDTGAKAVQAMLVDAGRPREGIIATLLGLGALLFAAIGVVVQLKDALNTVWEVDETPGHGIWHFMRNYVASLAAVLALGFLLLVSLVVTAGLAAFGKYAAPYVQEWLLHLISIVVSLSVISLLFAMMFKWLPDAAVDWYDVWLEQS